MLMNQNMLDSLVVVCTCICGGQLNYVVVLTSVQYIL